MSGGAQTDADSPRWARNMHVGNVRHFPQPRSMASDFFAKLATSYMNISEVRSSCTDLCFLLLYVDLQGYSSVMLRGATDIAVRVHRTF